MNLTELSSKLFSFINDKYFIYSKKSWIYKDNIIVLDFIYSGTAFAIDIFYEKNKLCMDVVSRNNDNLIYSNKKTRIFSDIDAELVFKNLDDELTNIFKFIDGNFEYEISVIVPVYNRQELIQACIESINAQTLDKKRFEVIFVDDFSSDESIKVIRRKINKNINYKILKRPINSGSASAPRNDGILASKGKYIYFVDSDDYIYSYTLLEMLDSVKQNDADVVYVKYSGDKGRSWGTRPFLKGNVLNASISSNHLVRSLMSSKLIRAEVIKKNKIFYPMNIKVGEDRLFMMQVLIASNKFNILGDKPYYYITNHDQGRITHSGVDLLADYRIISGVFQSVFVSEKTTKEKMEIVSAWMNVFVESYLILRLSNKKIDNKNKKLYFDRLFFEFSNIKSLINEDLIYSSFRDVYSEFAKNDYDLTVEKSIKFRESK